MKLDFHKNHRLLYGVVLFGFIALSAVVAMAPALSEVRRATPLPGAAPLTAIQRRGLDVYVAEGCLYCHTQQVRPLAQDTLRYGRASVAADFARIAPMDQWRGAPRVLGSERTGPDLTSIGTRQPSEVWHYIHLYQPRAVVAASIMPAYPWLFEHKAAAGPGDVVVPLPPEVAPSSGVVVARPAAQALVAYLLSRQQAPLAQTGKAATPPPTADNHGAIVYDTRCSSCHQPAGQGLPGAFPPLAGDPVVQAEDPTRHVEIVLFGLSGASIEGTAYVSPMPAWGTSLSDDEIAAVVNHERSSWGNAAPPVTAEFVARIRARGADAQ
ncbi:MAG: cbb3-type cytochrome c oxidase subunit II [Gemmatimonadales bacterium]